MFIPINTKQRNAFNNVNQLAKNIFYQGYIMRDQPTIYWTFKKDRYKNNLAENFVIIKNQMVNDLIDKIFEDNSISILKLDTAKIYNVIKDNKKHISHLIIYAGSIYLGSEDNKFLIGSYNEKIKEEEKEMLDSNIISTFLRITEEDEFADDEMRVNDIDINRINDKDLLKISQGEFKLRVTKQLIPNHKNKSLNDIWIYFKKMKLYNLSKAIIKINFDDIISYHVYDIINY